MHRTCMYDVVVSDPAIHRSSSSSSSASAQEHQLRDGTKRTKEAEQLNGWGRGDENT